MSDEKGLTRFSSESLSVDIGFGVSVSATERMGLFKVTSVDCDERPATERLVIFS
jgi:hypothetical protein